MDWLWEDRIPMGNLSCVFGMPGIGKSQLSVNIAAQASLGTLPGQYQGQPINVLMSSAEDSIEFTVRPRLEAAGADLSRVILAPEPLLVPDDTDELERLIVEHNIQLVILDPLMAHLGRSASAGNDQKVRLALTPLVQMVAKHNCAVLFVSHPTKIKAKVQNVLDLLGGSRGIGGAFRSIMFFGKDPDEPTNGRLLAMTKNNLAPFAPTIAYSIEVADVEVPGRLKDGPARIKVPVAYLEEMGTSKLADVDIVNAKDDRKGPTKMDKAIAFVGNMLAFGKRPANEVLVAGQQAGFSEKMIRQASKQLGVEVVKSGFQGTSYWEIPVEDDDEDDGSQPLTVPANWQQ